jgi:hypothetical protein
MNDELERIWKEAVCGLLVVLPWNFPGWAGVSWPQDSNRAPAEYEEGGLPLHQSVWSHYFRL